MDIFISHSSRDKLLADAMVAMLEQRGLRCWIAPRDIRPGASWSASILEAIEKAKVMVLVFSDAANTSPHIQREVERGVHNGLTLVPFRIAEVLPSKELEYFISHSHWLDAMTSDMEGHLTELADTLEHLLGHAAEAPATSHAPSERRKRHGRHRKGKTPSPPTRARTAKWIGSVCLAATIGLIIAGSIFLSKPTDYYLRFENESLIDVPSLRLTTSEPLCFEFWISDVDRDNSGYLAQVNYPDTDGDMLALLSVPTRQGYTVRLREKNLYKFVQANSGVRGSGRLIHVAGVRDQGEIRVYVNGFLKARTRVPEAFVLVEEPGPVILARQLVGNIHSMRISSMARYTETFTPPADFEADAGTLVLFRMDEGKGADLKDLSGNGHHGRMVGATWREEQVH